METTPSAQVSVSRVDTHLGKFSQGCTLLLTALAFLFNQPVIVLITAIVMAISALAPAASPYRLLYRGIVGPSGLLKPRIVEDDPAPHRFAQGIGALFLVAASIILYFTHAATLGWILDLIVFVLAGVNLTIGFCAGCFVYYHLGRLGLLVLVGLAAWLLVWMGKRFVEKQRQQALAAVPLINTAPVPADRGKHARAVDPSPVHILAFSSADCRQCHQLQLPALQRVLAARGDSVTVVDVDATMEHWLTRAYHVLTVSSTVVLDAEGNAHAVN